MARAMPFGDKKQSIEHCLACYRTCTETAMTHTLEAGGEHAEPAHFRLMLNCADICRTTADFLMSDSEFRLRLCSLCADICETCAESCRQIGGMEACARACEACAGSCAAISAQTRTPQREPLLTHPKARFV